MRETCVRFRGIKQLRPYLHNHRGNRSKQPAIPRRFLDHFLVLLVFQQSSVVGPHEMVTGKVECHAERLGFGQCAHMRRALGARHALHERIQCLEGL